MSNNERIRQMLAHQSKPEVKVDELGATVIKDGVASVFHAWDFIHLPKAQRKGKTYEEIQQIRKKIWLSQYEVKKQ